MFLLIQKSDIFLYSGCTVISPKNSISSPKFTLAPPINPHSPLFAPYKTMLSLEIFRTSMLCSFNVLYIDSSVVITLFSSTLRQEHAVYPCFTLMSLYPLYTQKSSRFLSIESIFPIRLLPIIFAFSKILFG